MDFTHQNRPSQKETMVFQPSIFGYYVSFRGYFCQILGDMTRPPPKKKQQAFGANPEIHINHLPGSYGNSNTSDKYILGVAPSQ